MALIDREAAVEAVKNCHHFTEITINGKVSVNRDCFVSHVVATINALPEAFAPDWSPDQYVEPLMDVMANGCEELSNDEQERAAQKERICNCEMV